MPRLSLLKLVNAESDDEFASSELGLRPKKQAATSTTAAQKKAAAKAKEAMPAAKKTAGRAAPAAKKATAAAASKVTKPAPKKTAAASRRTTGKMAAAIENSDEGQEAMAGTSTKAKAPPKPRGRKAAAAAQGDAEDPIAEESMVVTSKPAAKPKGGRGRPKKVVAAEEEEEEEVTEIPETQPEPSPAKPPPARRGRKPKASQEVVEIPETQPVPEDVEMDDLVSETDVDAEEEEEDEEEEERNVPGAFPAETVPGSAARNTRRPGKAVVPRKTAKKSAPQGLSDGSGEEDIEGAYTKPGRTARSPPLYGLDDMTIDTPRRNQIISLEERYKKLENRHRDVREVAVREAENNFDRLKKVSEEKAAAADKLIGSLKAEIAALRTELSSQKKQAVQTVAERAELEASYKAELDRAAAENKQLRAQAADFNKSLAEVTKSLSEARAESKNLVVKLAAARTNEATKAAAATVPGSAMKPGRMQANGDALQAARQMQLKEDMYADLTALIVRAVKKEGDDDVFDCLQTGPNGTLHFKLTVANDAPEKDYDEAQYIYTPQLDPGRDRDLIALLPNFLTEEIGFPRAQATKFYARVMGVLNKRVVEEGSEMEDDDSEAE